MKILEKIKKEYVVPKMEIIRVEHQECLLDFSVDWDDDNDENGNGQYFISMKKKEKKKYAAPKMDVVAVNKKKFLLLASDPWFSGGGG